MDVSIGQIISVPLVIEAHHIPVGTVVEVQLRPIEGAMTVIEAPPLEGTYATSSSTVYVFVGVDPVEIQLLADWTP